MQVNIVDCSKPLAQQLTVKTLSAAEATALQAEQAAINATETPIEEKQVPVTNEDFKVILSAMLDIKAGKEFTQEQQEVIDKYVNYKP